MDYLSLFTKYLLDDEHASQATVKNYVADVKKFITWYVGEFKTTFYPAHVTPQILSLYWDALGEKNETTANPRSLKRYTASLKHFFRFLEGQRLITDSPFMPNKPKEEKDPNGLIEFKHYLILTGASSLTVKNYVHDVASFVTWVKQVTDTSPDSGASILPAISAPLVQEYKKRLTYDRNLSASSVNRKLSSLRKFTAWGTQTNKLPGYREVPLENIKIQPQNESTETPSTEVNQSPIFIANSLNAHSNESTQSSFDDELLKTRSAFWSNLGPVRLAKAGGKLATKAIDLSLIPLVLKLSEGKEYLSWLRTGKKVFDEIPVDGLVASKLPSARSKSPAILPSLSNISKSFYAPISLEGKSFVFQVMYVLKYRRPQWYKRYHSHAFTHYLHFSILMLAISVMGYIFMNHVGITNAEKIAFGRSSFSQARILSYSGVLKDAQGNPITEPTTIRFNIYNDQNASDSAHLWSETQEISPHEDGTFTAEIGKGHEIDPRIFSDNQALYLGLSLGGQEDLLPRQQIATVSLSEEAQSIQGLRPITQPGVGGKNALLALGSDGNVTITGSQQTTFQSLDGSMAVSGQALLLTTTPGNNGDIIVSPDGLGTIDLQKPIHNTSDYTNAFGVPGAINLDDTVAIDASESGRSALYINQNGDGLILSGMDHGSAKFSVGNDGSGFFAGNVGIGTSSPAVQLDVKGSIQAEHLGLGMMPNDAYAIQTSGNIRGASLVADQLKATVTEDNSLVKLLVSAPASQSADLAQFQVDNTTLVKITADGNVGIGINPPSEKLGVNGNAIINGNLTISGGTRTIANTSNDTLIIGNGGTGDILFQPNGMVGFGTASPKATVQIGKGSLCVAVDCSGIDNTVDGQIYATQTNIVHADVAEDYPTNDDSISAGDIVVLDPENSVFVKKSTGSEADIPLGVVSTEPGVRLGGFLSEAYKDKKQVPIGLSGRIPVKVSMEGGTIHIGDPLTLSSTPGVAMKATGPGRIIGRALSNYDTQDNTSIGSVMFFISNGFSTTQMTINNNGELTSPLAMTKPGDQTSFTLTDKIGRTANLVMKQLFADGVTVKEISADTIYIGGKNLSAVMTDLLAKLPTLQTNHLIAPIADIDVIHTNTISPIDGTNIALSLKDNQLTVKKDDKPVASIDAQGNASFSGKLSASAVQTADATVSGTLHAGRIVADQIDGLPQASPSANYITNVTNVYQTASPSASSTDPNSLLSDKLNSDFVPSASLSGFFGNIPNIKLATAEVSQGLMVFGPTSLADTSVAGMLSVNGSLILSDNSINVLGADLSLQPLRQGGIRLMGGMIKIDTDGNVDFGGNATFAKDVIVKGKLAANIIVPVPDQDLSIQLGQDTHKFQVTNASQSAVLTITSTGDLAASGAGSFQDVIAKTFNVVRAAQADTSLTETVATASAGTAVILPGQLERTIISPFVKQDSLIYITPATNTEGVTPYLSRQTIADPVHGTKASFTIAIPEVLTQEVRVNWWIVN